MLLYDMLWTNHDAEHIQALLKYAKVQRDLHQAESFNVETEQYRSWMTKPSEKGCRGLYRTLKRDEMPFIRPFQNCLRVERMAKRIQQ